MAEDPTTWMSDADARRKPARRQNPVGAIAFLLTLLPPIAWFVGYSLPVHAVAANTVAFGITPVAFIVSVIGVFRKPRLLAFLALLIALVEMQLLAFAVPTLLSAS